MAALVVAALLAAASGVLMTPAVSLASAGVAGVDWSAAADLPPLVSSDPGGTVLRRDGVGEVSCLGSTCVTSTIRPVLRAEIDPDGNGDYHFQLYDVSGDGGTAEIVASHSGPDATFVPDPDVDVPLRHGHTYAWTVVGADGQTQEWSRFLVDLQRASDQPMDDVGPISVGLATGAPFVTTDAAVTARGENLTLAYTAPGASNELFLPSGWTLAGPVMEHISFERVERFGNDVVRVHRLDGTTIRYERDADGVYQPPTIDGAEVPFLYPELVVSGSGWMVIDGNTVSTFAANGELAGVEVTAPDGTVVSDVSIEASGGVLRSITDAATGQTVTFGYLGDFGVEPPAGFDEDAEAPRLASVTGVDGTVTNLAYLDGRLARIETAGATTDMAWDETGRLVAIREPIAADTVAAAVRADDTSVLWELAYGPDGQVATVTEPAATEGAARGSRSYEYGPHTSMVFVHGENGPVEALTVTYDEHDLRMQTQVVAGRAPATNLYDDDGVAYGWIDPTGAQTSYVHDADSSTTVTYGPAPASWFAPGGAPLPEYADRVATTTKVAGAGAGMVASFSDRSTSGTVAMRLLTDDTVTAPAPVDVSAGWGFTATGDPRVDAGTSYFRLGAEGADETSATLFFDGSTCGLDEACQIDVAEPGRVALVIEVELPAGQDSTQLAIEHSTDGDTWTPVEFDSMTGHDLPTMESSTEQYRSGDSPMSVDEATVYTDEASGEIGSYTRAGEAFVHLGYEPADPANDQWRRTTSITRPSGLTTTLDYWGSSERAEHPLTGEHLVQAGARKRLQVGDGSIHTTIYDERGRAVATEVDGVVSEALVFDDRGRTERVFAAGNGVAPERNTSYIHGADGDPMRTDSVVTIGVDEYVTSHTVDLLGRTVSYTDTAGVTSDTTYDLLGNPTTITSTTPLGEVTTTTQTWDRDGLVEQHVVAIDGSVNTARITGRDQAGRITGIAYGNGVNAAISYDGVTGTADTVYTNESGETWSESITSSPHSGRLLEHRVSAPGADATFTYGYDPSSGALTDATLALTGDAPIDAHWTYTSTYPDGTCPDTGAALDGARAYSEAVINGDTTTTTTCYDANGAPTRQVQTIDAEGDVVTNDEYLDVVDGNIVGYGDLQLEYDVRDHLMRASDTQQAIDLVRTADGTIIEQTTTPTGALPTTIRYSTAGVMLDDEHGVVGQRFSLPGGVTVNVVADDDTTWTFTTTNGDIWFTTNHAGAAATNQPTLYDPDGQQLTNTGEAYGWKSDHKGHALDLDTDLVIFGARVYLPGLATFTSPDAQAHGGSTQYNYVNGDSINLVDPTGFAPKWFNDAATWIHNLPSWIDPIIDITIGVISIIPGVGTMAGAMLAALATGYYILRSVASFATGDIVGGIAYAVAAAVTAYAAVTTARLALAGEDMYMAAETQPLDKEELTPVRKLIRRQQTYDRIKSRYGDKVAYNETKVARKLSVVAESAGRTFRPQVIKLEVGLLLGALMQGGWALLDAMYKANQSNGGTPETQPAVVESPDIMPESPEDAAPESPADAVPESPEDAVPEPPADADQPPQTDAEPDPQTDAEPDPPAGLVAVTDLSATDEPSVAPEPGPTASQSADPPADAPSTTDSADTIDLLEAA
ncbi:MAG: RHS repeat-associated core domain-containing protein [Actinomycetota bacterium]